MKEEKPDLMLVTEENTEKQDERKKLRKRLLKVMGIIVLVLVLLLVVLFVINLIKGHTLSYEEIEKEMASAAKKYYQVQTELLPQKEGEKATIDASVLSEGEYMKPLREYTKEGVSCTGEVQVTKIGKQNIYTPYLDCGKAYQTKELYKAVLEQGEVSSGYGLYKLGTEYVYRGEEVSNYVSFEGVLWQIVKVTENNEVVLILADKDYMPIVEWDDRYNQNELSKTGINTYHVSRIKEALSLYYKENTDDTISFSKSGKEKLAPFSVCVGARNKALNVNDNSKECSVVEENQMIGLLTVSDYLNASVDVNCHATKDRSCQNYNYLKISKSWWLSTPTDENSKDVYYVLSSGVIGEDEANSSNRLRPVIHLNNQVMIKSGKGTEENPFLLK